MNAGAKCPRFLAMFQAFAVRCLILVDILSDLSLELLDRELDSRELKQRQSRQQREGHLKM